MIKKFGIIGNPIKHSLSPILHNYWFKKYNIDANYSIIDAKDENEFPEIVRQIRNKEISGINITLPYKQKIVSHVDILVNDAEITSSVNTIYLDQKNVVGENTDVFGLQAAYLKEIDNASKKKTLIIGAGGVSPSVILSLQKSGVKEISITNRTREKCIFLKNKFNTLKIIEWRELQEEIKNFDIIINATSLGLKGNKDFDFNFNKIKHNLIYIDTIYNPLETKTLKFLKKMDIKVFNGLNMFIYQGQKAFYLWNKINPEIDEKLIELLISNLK
tara:strand:+ start:2672 stop:3493 length:822 start_codon:yes stop_codon:yes gene_type:complete